MGLERIPSLPYPEGITGDVGEYLKRLRSSLQQHLEARPQDFEDFESSLTVTGITPEQYGAKGDGSTDDWSAFNNMFTDIATKNCKKITLRPENYYSIQSRKNATNCFEIEAENLIIEGCGMNTPTIIYEGADTVTNFFNFAGGAGVDNSSYLKIDEMFIKGGADKSASKVTTIINYNDTKYTTLERLQLYGCTGKAIDGFNWMTEIRHCILYEAGWGMDVIATTAYVANCYANKCTVGYLISSYYGTYIGCACDHATKAYDLDVSRSIALIGCGCEVCDQAITGRALGLSVQGFHGESTASPAPDSFIELDETKGVIQGCYFASEVKNTYWIKATKSPDLLIGPEFPKDKIYDFGNVDNDPEVPIRLGQDGGGYYVDSWDADEFKTSCETVYTKYNSTQWVRALYGTGTGTYTATTTMGDLKGYGFLTIESTAGAIFQFTHTSGDAIRIINARMPIKFKGIHFKQSGTGALFSLNNVLDLQFENCTFETTLGSGEVFDIDDSASYPNNITIDKDTMDNMTGSWSGLTDRNAEDIKFIGYTVAPTNGYFEKGCRVVFSSPDAGADFGVLCEVSGDPGTWGSLGSTFAGQIAFPATQNSSANANTLDDYEEGTWTPSVGGNATYDRNVGRYIKIGKHVTVWADLQINVLGTGSTTTISGLPFISTNVEFDQTGTVGYFNSLAVNVLFIACYVPVSATTIAFVSMVAAGTDATDAPAIFGNSARVQLTICYEAAD